MLLEVQQQIESDAEAAVAGGYARTGSRSKIGRKLAQQQTRQEISTAAANQRSSCKPAQQQQLVHRHLAVHRM